MQKEGEQQESWGLVQIPRALVAPSLGEGDGQRNSKRRLVQAGMFYLKFVSSLVLTT